MTTEPHQADPAGTELDRTESGAPVGVAVAVAEPAGDTAPAELPWELIDDTPLPPRRPKLVTTTTLVLFGGLLVAGGFAAGAKVGRDHVPAAASTPNVAGFGANRATGTGGTGAAPTGATGATGATGVPGATGQGAAAGGLPTGPSGNAGTGAGGGATFGQVKLVDGNALYIQDAQGNVVKVTLAAVGTVTVSKPGTLADLKVGENVILQGTAGDDGATFSATAITPAGALGGRNRGAGQGGSGGTGAATGQPPTGAANG